jgi:putative ABC transport system permease protein
VDLTILGQATTFPEELYSQVLATEGVAAAWPLYQIDVALDDRDDFFLQVFGVDLLAPVRLPFNSAPADLSQALFQPGWIAVTPSLAQDMGWAIGNPIAVTSGTRRVQLVIGALVDFQKVSPLASRKMAVMDIAQVQGLLGSSGRIHQIDVQTQEGTSREELILRLQNRLGPSVQVVTPQQREKQAADLMGAFRLNLTALSFISLFVGLFLIYTSTQASLLRRRLEFGLLRSVGATRAQVFGLILGEVSLLGLFGVILGLPIGYWVARSNVEMVSATLTNLYLLQEIDSLQLSPSLYALGAGIGLGGAIAGAFFPAIDISRKNSKSLLTAFTLHEKANSLALPVFGMGWLVLMLSVLWFWFLGQSWKPAGFVLAVAVLVALPLLTPFLIQQTCGRIKTRGFGLGYSLKSLAARLQTTSFAVSSLAIAVSMLMGITLMVGSFRKTVEVWVQTTVQADIYLTTPSWRAEAEATLDPELVSALAGIGWRCCVRCGRVGFSSRNLWPARQNSMWEIFSRSMLEKENWNFPLPESTTTTHRSWDQRQWILPSWMRPSEQVPSIASPFILRRIVTRSESLMRLKPAFPIPLSRFGVINVCERKSLRFLTRHSLWYEFFNL